jgi:predicted nucleotidyltransferase
VAAERLVSALFPKSRRMVLGLLMSHPDRAFYLREIAEITGLGVGHVQRELGRLVKAGIIHRFKQGRHVYFRADPACSIFDELRGIVIKTVGVGDVLRHALMPLRDRIRVAFVFGSVARREEHSSSDVDLMVIGDVSLAEVVGVIRDVEQSLGRPVNPTVYPPAEFSSKLAVGHHFVTKVVEREKLMLIGDEDDIAALFGK